MRRSRRGNSFSVARGGVVLAALAVMFVTVMPSNAGAKAPAANAPVVHSRSNDAAGVAHIRMKKKPKLSITQQVLNILAPAGGVHGVYLQQIGGPVLASSNATFPFEPASSIKSVVALYAMTQVANGAAHLTDQVPVVPGSSPEDCPSPTTSGTEDLEVAIQHMMQVSDNNRTLELMLYFGVANLNAFAASMGLSNTMFQTSGSYPGFNIIGCDSYGFRPTVDGNTTSLVDLSKVWAAAEALPPPYSDEYVQLAAGRDMYNTQGYDFTGLWPNLMTIARTVAPRKLKLAYLFSFEDHMTVSVKGGNYLAYFCTSGSNCENTWWVFAGTAQIPSCSGRTLVHTNYTWGYFIHDANGPYSANPNLTTAGMAFFNASGQLFSQPIQAALKTWKKCAPAVNPVLGASGTSITSGVHVDMGATLATVTDADVTDIASDLKGTISWGDSSPSSPATISGGNGNFTAHGSHTYPGPGTYSVTVSIAPALGTHYPTANSTITVS